MRVIELHPNKIAHDYTVHQVNVCENKYFGYRIFRNKAIILSVLTKFYTYNFTISPHMTWVVEMRGTYMLQQCCSHVYANRDR